MQIAILIHYPDQFKMFNLLKNIDKISIVILLLLSIQLQSNSIDYSKTIDMIKFVESLNTIRDNSIRKFKIIFYQTKIITEKNGYRNKDSKNNKQINDIEQILTIKIHLNKSQISNFLPYIKYLLLICDFLKIIML